MAMITWSREALWQFAIAWFASEGELVPAYIVVDEMWGAYCWHWDREERMAK